MTRPPPNAATVPAEPGAPVSAVSDGPSPEMPSLSCPGWFDGSAPRPAPADPGAPVPCGRPTPNIEDGYWPGCSVTSPPPSPAAIGAPAPETSPPPCGFWPGGTAMTVFLPSVVPGEAASPPGWVGGLAARQGEPLGGWSLIGFD